MTQLNKVTFTGPVVRTWVWFGGHLSAHHTIFAHSSLNVSLHRP